ncbi:MULTISPECIES: hypothetical protein [unclassified Paenibacillus]|uniref:hypothetical protein n=1 Tax=unclassified Paenibacillus TaxID=185978 RepID=UPI00363B6708
MSMRPVELQFALHKNDEAGMLQNQLNHKPQQDQVQLAAASLKHAEKERQVASKADDVLHASVHDQERDKSGDRRQKSRSKPAAGATEDSKAIGRNDHPYKGKHIDLSL